MSDGTTFIDLGKYRPTAESVRAFMEKHKLPIPPDFGEREHGAILATRRRAREVIAEHPGAEVVVLECSGVEVLGVTFLHELAKRWWPNISLEGATEDHRISWDLVAERMDQRG